ncbi:MAG: hypothetical protein IJ833_07565 [Lachnospiraceae bacterium]|nr:hypothetical protein [Lachnospiraceae bacterium]
MKKQTIKRSKSFYQKWWFWTIIVLLGFAGLGSGGDKNKENDTVAVVENTEDTADVQERSLSPEVDPIIYPKGPEDTAVEDNLNTTIVSVLENSSVVSEAEGTTERFASEATVSPIEDTVETSTASNSSDTEVAVISDTSSETQDISTDTSANFDAYYTPEQQQTEDTYVLNTNTMKIHHPYCKSVSKIKPENYATTNLSIAELEAQGYTKCGQKGDWK